MNHSEHSLRDINSLAKANLFAQLADQLSLTAIPLIAVLYLKLGAEGVGFLNAFQTLPYFALSIPLGVLVDRMSKKRLILTTESLRIAALLGILAMIHFEILNLWSLALLSLAAALGSVGFNAALPAYMPTLVDRSQLRPFTTVESNWSEASAWRWALPWPGVWRPALAPPTPLCWGRR